VENVALPTLAGEPAPLLSDTNVSVFIFLKPGQEHSNHVMVQLTECAREFADQPVHWAAVVSDRVPAAAVAAAVRDTGFTLPILVDRGDVLYGKLGVFLCPVIGVTDADRRLVAYQPFAEVNYAAFLRAQIRHALKQITDAELAEALHPPAAVLGGEASVAHRYFRLAGKQFVATNYNQALTNLQHSLDHSPSSEAYVLRGRILTAQGDRAAATAAFEAALQLDPRDAAALAGLDAGRESGGAATNSAATAPRSP
jgi:tetratricopeptide (TPR) repeat protein